MTTRQAHPLFGVILVSAAVLAGILLFNVHRETQKAQIVETTRIVDITVDHAAPVTLTVLQSAGKDTGIVEFRADGTETVTLNLPSSWQRREVRGAALDAVKSETGTDGTTRWHLPPRVTLSMRIEENSPALTIRNPSGIALLVSAKRINVVTGVIEKKDVLVKDGELHLW